MPQAVEMSMGVLVPHGITHRCLPPMGCPTALPTVLTIGYVSPMGMSKGVPMGSSVERLEATVVAHMPRLARAPPRESNGTAARAADGTF